MELVATGPANGADPEIGDNALARLHIIIKTKPGNIPRYKKSHIEADLLDVTCSWGDSLLENLTEIYGKEKALNLYKRYIRLCKTIIGYVLDYQ